MQNGHFLPPEKHARTIPSGPSNIPRTNHRQPFAPFALAITAVTIPKIIQTNKIPILNNFNGHFREFSKFVKSNFSKTSKEIILNYNDNITSNFRYNKGFFTMW